MTTNTEIKRYYLYNFIISAIDTGSGHFTMVYFYFHGFSLVAVLGAILTYGLTCLAILKPVGILIEKIGPQNTFRLHGVAEALKYFSLISIFIFPVHKLEFFVLWQFFNGFNVMLMRIPLTAYFSVYGDSNQRGSQVGLTNNIQILASVVVPVIAGALIEQTGIVLITTIATAVNIFAIFVLKFDGQVKMENPVNFKRLFSSVPMPFTKSFFFGKLVYPFSADLLSIYIAISLQSFAVLGIFIGLRTAVNIFLNYFVGRMTDTRIIRPFFFGAVLVSSAFWLVLPFVQEASAIFLLQFTLGLAGLITSIPFESVYHNIAKKSGKPVQFALWREVAIQTGLVVGSAVIILLLKSNIVRDWRLLLPLGSISALALLFILPYLSDSRKVVKQTNFVQKN